MKKLILSLAACAVVASAAAFPKAIYVKQGDVVTKYNFGVAGDLVFSNGGRSLAISGYNELINLDNIDYISFTAPVDQTAITPAEQKQKMVEIGEEINSYIDLDRNADLLNMWHCFFDHLDLNGSWVHPPVEFEVPEEYYDVHNAFRSAMKSVKDLANGNAAAARAFKASAVDLYKVSDYFGVYYANPNDETWHKTASADFLEIRFNDYLGGIYFARLTASDEYTTWTSKDFDGQMPRTMTVVFGRGTETFATAVITTELVQDQSIDMTLDFEANGYVVKDVMKVVNDKITDDVYVTIDGKQFVTAKSVVNGKNLVNYDIMYNDIREACHYHDEDGECCGEDPSQLIAHFFRATSDVDVIGRLQAKAKMFDISDVYDELSKETYFDELIDGNYRIYTSGKVLSQRGDVVSVTYKDSAILESMAKKLNDFSDASFYYDKQKQQQGYLTWDIDEDIYDYYVSNDGHSGYIIKDGYLVSVRQTYIGYDNNGNPIWSDDYYYSASKFIDGEYVGWDEIAVPASAVITPSVIKESYCDLMPVLTFPDLTTYAVEDFFDENSFKKLIDDYNDIIDSYLKITGQDD